ncbi:tripartite tricarboxylate transporter TctB family protein [Corynebacterium sp. YIM 101645]|uniref:Tripartite tricarboxylate transporter TctB family protein n=1 Tax=Corynebacterium lemuris TaxID=1859292 RepID=A0ABT2FUT3_9CORY|nr:tripartite tricarboxylate transporter TctB family protein [Corynebacterium lemuris]MCS5478704.1 tripartite tricarboxylate transporter TctB family protein [Corynebacterium lemuris]
MTQIDQETGRREPVNPERIEETSTLGRAYSRWGWFSGRSELGFVALILVVATGLLLGTLGMEVLGQSRPGPQFFPVVVAIILYAAAIAITVSVVTRPTLPDGEPHPGRGNFSADLLIDISDVGEERVRRRYSKYTDDYATYSDWRTVGMVVGGIVLFILILHPVGWILSATALFWIVARALGSRRPLIDLGVALLFASVIQLAFNAGLGLPLPPGFLEGLL